MPTAGPPPSDVQPQGLVTLHLWGVRARRIPRSLWHMAYHRRLLRGTHGLRFARLLGTSSGETFDWRDADLRHWGVLAVWDDPADFRVFELGAVVHAWDQACFERARFLMRPVSSQGSWGGRQPFGVSDGAIAGRNGPVAALTRARLRPSRVREFWRAVPPISSAANAAPGLRLRLGVGEAPFALLGTFSVWDTASDLDAFAFGDESHLAAIRAREQRGWFSEEMFTRFSVLRADGKYRHRPVDSPAR